MATYDLDRTELSGTLADHGIEASLRAHIISTLEDVGVFGHGHHDSDAVTSIVHSGETASSDS